MNAMKIQMQPRFYQKPSCPIICLVMINVLLILAVHGCGWMAGPPQQDPEADALLDRWGGNNATLKQVKGFMRIQMDTSGSRLSGRAGWAAVFPDRIRIELLSFLGQPLMKFAANGKHIVVIVTGEEKPHFFTQRPGALEKIIYIPMGIEDLLKILKGCPPATGYVAAQLRNRDGRSGRVVLLDRWHSPVAELKGDDDGSIHEMVTFDSGGALLYRITWRGWMLSKGYRIPKEIEIVTGKGDRLSLLVDRFYPNSPVSNELFEMESVGAF